MKKTQNAQFGHKDPFLWSVIKCTDEFQGLGKVKMVCQKIVIVATLSNDRVSTTALVKTLIHITFLMRIY